MNIASLINAGLTKNEIKVYLTLLELGDTTTGPLIKKTEITSSKVYESLDRLSAKGLVSYTKKSNKRHFQAAEPERLLDYLDEKKRFLESDKDEIRHLLPELKLLQKEPNTEQQEAEIYQGVKGYRTLLENMLHELTPNGSYVAFASGLLKNRLGPYWFILQKKKKKSNIRSRCIWDLNVKKQKEYLAEYVGEGRFVSQGSFRSPVDVWTYHDKVIMVSYTTNPIFAILIRSKGLAQSYRELFENIWKTGKKK